MNVFLYFKIFHKQVYFSGERKEEKRAKLNLFSLNGDLNEQLNISMLWILASFTVFRGKHVVVNLGKKQPLKLYICNFTGERKPLLTKAFF